MMTSMTQKQQLGSTTAKGGFANELDIVDKFNNYHTDQDAHAWLTLMGYNPNQITDLKAVAIATRLNKNSIGKLGLTPEQFEHTQKFKKADLQIQLCITIDDIIYRENISCKKADKTANFNQIDKRSVQTYQQMWQFDDAIATTLKKFTGEITPSADEALTLKDKRRWYLDELPAQDIAKLIKFFEKNKLLVISDILKGRGMLSAEWFLVTKKDGNQLSWVLKNINEVINFYAQGDITLSARGGLVIGRLTAQRKGGTPDPTSLQFKIKPLDLFDINH